MQSEDAPRGRGTAHKALLDWRFYPLLVVVLAFLGQAAGATTTQALSTIYVFLKDEFLLSRGQVGLFTSAMFASGALTALAAGWSIDRFGVRKVFPLMLALLALGFLAFSSGSSLPMFLAVAAFLGALLPVNNPAATKVVLEWTPRRLRGSAMGIKQASVPTMGAISAAAFPALALAAGWRSVLYVLAAVTVTAGIAIFLLYRERPEVGSTDKKKLSFFKGLRLVATDTRVLAGSAVSVIMIGLYFVPITYLILYLNESIGFSVTAAGFGLAAFQGASIAGRLFWGAFSDTVMKGRRMPVLYIIFVSTAGFMAALAAISHGAPSWVVWPVVLGLGFTGAAFQGLFYTQLAETVGPSLVGTAMGFNGTILRFGPIAITPIFGFVVDSTGGDYRIAWLGAAALTVVATMCLRWMGKNTAATE